MRPIRVLAFLLLVMLPVGAMAQQSDEAQARIEAKIAKIASGLAALCPLAAPDDQAAFDRCRFALFRDTDVRQALGTILLWGRPDPNPKVTLKDTTLTQFAPEVWSGLYAPLFMFDGHWTVTYDPREKLYRAQVSAVFRNALAPGEYPYPFWHNAAKWNDYQHANAIVFWARPGPGTFVAGQFFNTGIEVATLKTPPHIPPVFDGKWMWTDANGKSQPQPALFQGLFRPENPFLAPLEPSYRDLANAMRNGHCNECHVPNNPSGMKRLVLLQTPAHAASEIKRVMAAVRDDKMPQDDIGLYQEIDPDTKAALLKYGAAFEAVVDAARNWEKTHPIPH